jgi:hypothetical protein
MVNKSPSIPCPINIKTMVKVIARVRNTLCALKVYRTCALKVYRTCALKVYRIQNFACLLGLP